MIAGFFVMAWLALLGKLAYVQLVQHRSFTVQAEQNQWRKFELPAPRGEIYVQDRGELSPLALNRTSKLVYADPRYVKDVDDTAVELSKLLQKSKEELVELIQLDSFYVPLAHDVDKAVSKKIEEAELGGIGVQDVPARFYPENSLAAQTVGFTNRDGMGQYGIEAYFDDILGGEAGLLQAKTDTRGIPIATNDNIQQAPKPGSDVVLTIDRNIQARVEQILAEGLQKYEAKTASAVVLDSATGAIRAIANVPTFDPNNFGQVEDLSVFQNRAAHGLFEPGSGFKIFSMATGLNEGAVTPGEEYYDPGSVKVDDYVIKNAEGGGLTRTMTDVIEHSVNTGVVYVLQQLGGGDITQEAKETLYRYYSQRFRFGQGSGVELPGEPDGFIETPESSDVRYANMTFGQGISMTMVQTVAAMNAAVNGGTYYEPHLLAATVSPGGEVVEKDPKVVVKDVVSQTVSDQLKAMMEGVVLRGGGYGTRIPGYRIGGKTGTAQIPNPDGGYFNDRDIGSFTGFAPYDNPRYIMMVRVDEPGIPGYAGSAAAGPMFGDIMRFLMQYDGVAPDGS